MDQTSYLTTPGGHGSSVITGTQHAVTLDQNGYRLIGHDDITMHMTSSALQGSAMSSANSPYVYREHKDMTLEFPWTNGKTTKDIFRFTI